MNKLIECEDYIVLSIQQNTGEKMEREKRGMSIIKFVYHKNSFRCQYLMYLIF